MRKKTDFKVPYESAETPIKGAPFIQEDDGHGCIPQHFLQYDHSYDSLVQIINDIEFCDKYPIFVSEENSCLTLQVGVIGYDNYKPKSKSQAKHIVYGRKWRVERNLPSSEIIQTAFLALQKAREHEVRELLTLKSAKSNKRSTPFSGHHDIPYLAERLGQTTHTHRSESITDPIDLIKAHLQRLQFDGKAIQLVQAQQCFENTFAVKLEIQSIPDVISDMPEMDGITLQFLLNNLDANTIYISIMNALIDHSNTYVAEHFKYRGFKRFSAKTSIADIGDISISLRDQRNVTQLDEFVKSFRATNSAVDATRVPVLKNAMLDKIGKLIQKHNGLEGHLPKKIRA